MHERDVARDGRLEDEPPPAELAGLLLVPRDGDPGGVAPRLQADRDRAFLDGRRRARGGEERREARRVRVQPADERALRDELERDLAREILLLEELVPTAKLQILKRMNRIYLLS